MLSYHTCPLAILGGKDTGGMNVYVRELTRYLGQRGVQVDVFTRSQDEHVPHVLHDLAVIAILLSPLRADRSVAGSTGCHSALFYGYFADYRVK
jgi:hypothetical protein